MQKFDCVTEVKKNLDQLACELGEISSCLEVLENSLYFASERKDKDMTKPCAAAAEAILAMVEVCRDAVIEMVENFDTVESL